jgi:hypothetical protein
MRNLLPLLRRDPNPANIAPAPVGEWTAGQIGTELPKLEFGNDRSNELRNRVQSIPSPWARMTLFRNALEEDAHPARRLIESELLDAFEFLWELNGLTGSLPDLKQIRIPELAFRAESAGSERVEDFAAALMALLPGVEGEPSGERALESITVLVLDGRPVLASSPYTGLFTAEDAAGERTGRYFRYLAGDEFRSLKDRPFDFQRYVAEVLLPQLDESAPDGVRPRAWATIRRLLKPWLEGEVAACNRNVRPGQPLLKPAALWRERADELRLSSIGHTLGGLTLYKRDAGAAAESSRWRLASGRAGARPVLVIDPAIFDNELFYGAAKVSLPKNLDEHDRNVLPGLNVRFPWVNPAADWFTERLMVLAEPIEHQNAYGYERLTNSYSGGVAALRTAQFVLPLQPGILEHFSPEALDKVLAIQVFDSGEVEVRLTLQLGLEGAQRPVEIRKRYQSAQIFRTPGPSLAVYPTFRHPRWRDYTVFVRAENSTAASLIRVRAHTPANPSDCQRVQRSSLVEILACTSAPEALVLESVTAGTGARDACLGIILPKYEPVRAETPGSLTVGVDFGTSNTVVCVRGDQGHARPLSIENGLLELTKPTEETRRAQSSFFFPERFKPGPFGTAVLHYAYLTNYDLAAERPGLRINVPFEGLVESDSQNVVAGDLKWSTDQRTDFLGGSFLRVVLSNVVAEALKQGVDPARIRIRWAYPRAFSQAQVNNLRNFWRAVVASFRANGLELQEPEEPIDESRAVLAHFFNETRIAPNGPLSVLLDVGGGTSDLAIYERGHALVLDSLLFGGRNLTGQRIQGNTKQSRANPFVRAFAEWAKNNGLTTENPEGAALEKYIGDEQDHLAFSYSLSTQWFKSNGRRFVSQPTFFGLQAQILYFYGALFYYIGLTLRSLRDENALSSGGLPGTVIVAGNGSQYLHWLTELENHPDAPFGRFLSKMMADGAGVPDAPLPQVQISTDPKLEVALGLVAEQPATGLDVSGARGESLVGEYFSASFEGARVDLGATDRLDAHTTYSTGQISTLRFDTKDSQIAKFHDAFLAALPMVIPYGPQWRQNEERLRTALRKLDLNDLHQFVTSRLQFLSQASGGFRGSMFILEAGAVLERMAPLFFQ